MSLLQLKPALHRFDKSRFNDISELQSTSPTRDGWVAMMITCSELGFAPDSNSLFKPGQLFIVQNFGNVVLPDSCVTAGETRCVIAATEREIQHIIVCGHLSCRTVGHFLEKGSRSVIWLEHGNRLRDLVQAHYPHLTHQQMVDVGAQENVLIQLEHLLADIDVTGANIRVQGWLLDDDTQRIYSYNVRSGQFERT